MVSRRFFIVGLAFTLATGLIVGLAFASSIPRVKALGRSDNTYHIRPTASIGTGAEGNPISYQGILDRPEPRTRPGQHELVDRHRTESRDRAR